MEQKSSDTQRITLRPFVLSDVDDYMVWASDDRVCGQYCTWDAYTNKDDLLKFMNETVLPHPWWRAICLDGRPVGGISLIRSSGNEWCKGELGYVLAFECWGKGIGTEAVRLAVKTVFGELEGLERVEALVDADNVGSQRVLEKAGFTKEGVMRKYLILKGRIRDMVMFSILSTDAI